MQLLHVTHPSGFDHDTGRYHPERPARLEAASQGVEASGVEVEGVLAVPLRSDDLTIVHDADYIDAIERFCRSGGGNLDADTHASEGSWPAALAAAGAGLTAVDRLRAGFEGAALVTVRPPGHHALPAQAMGFCLFNNVAVTAAHLRDSGQRVAVVDWDVHHGNGTQAMFYTDPDVLYLSLHQSPFYPYEGRASEVGEGRGEGATVNVPLPAFTAGDVYRQAFRRFVAPALAAFEPDWVLVSAGFDAHLNDPLAELCLTAGDYGFIAHRLLDVVPANRVVVFLEGGYHLAAIRDSIRTVVRTLSGLEAEWPESDLTSPPEASRGLERLHGVLRGMVPGID